MDPAAYVLQEIASETEAGGADPRAIRVLVHRRQNIDLEDEEVDAALQLLEEWGHIVELGDRYVLSPSILARVPREADGTVATGRQTWVRFCGALGLAGG